MKIKKVCSILLLTGSIIAVSCFPIESFAASYSEGELLTKYADKFKVIEKKYAADNERLKNENYMQNKVYANGILYSAYLSGNHMEYD